MATQYTSILKLALPVQGELSGTWGDVVNDNITSMVEEAIAGRAVINTWTTNSHTLTTADGTTSESRAAILTLTDTGTALTGAGTVICPAASKIYIVENGTGQTITIKTSAGTGVAVDDGENVVVFCDGTNVESTGGDGFDPNVDNPAIGNGASAGTEAVSIGHDAGASGNNSISIGRNSDATQTGGVAVGAGAQATGSYSTAINEGLASGANSIAIGPNSDATSNAAIAIGSLSNALNANTIHINASGTNTAVNTAGHMRIETDDAKIEYDGNWDMSGGTLTLGAVTYPNTDGTANQVLTTDGAGSLSFTTLSSGGIAAVVDDTTPQLGGNLDVNGNSIVSASNGDIAISPNGTGTVIIDGLTYPSTDGTNGQVLTTDGAGALSFADAGGGFDPNVDNPTIGNGASAGTDSVSIGHDAIGSGASSVLIGQNADGGTSLRATAVGSDVTANGADSVAVGHDANAESSSTAVGAESRALSALSCAFGNGADALASSSVAVGYNASVASIAGFGVAVGRQATVGNDDGIAIGYLANAGAANTLHINAAGVGTNAPATAGHMVIETDDAKIEYDGNWDMSGGTLTLGAVTYPNTDGTANQVLTTDGAGNLSFADASGGGFDPNVDNPAIGNGASTGTNAVAVGHDAVASGTRDVAIGFNVQVTNSSGFNSTAIGSDIAFGSSTYNNIAIGHDVSISNNVVGATVIGYEATTTGSSDHQVVVGYQATASGAGAVAVGKSAGASGLGGISIGQNSDATGSQSAAYGYNAQATGAQSVALGLNTVASASNTIAIGYGPDAVGDQAIAIGNDAVANGVDSIVIGHDALGASSANGVIAIGHDAQAQGASAVAIGYEAGADADNTIHISSAASKTNHPQTAGHMVIETDDARFQYATNGFSWFFTTNEEMRLTSAGDLHVDGNVTAYSTTISDRRLKSDITNISNALDKVGQINGVTFVRDHNGDKAAGIVAQEIMEVLPEAVKSQSLPLQTGTDDEYYVVEYDAVTGLLVEAVKELKERVEALEAE